MGEQPQGQKTVFNLYAALGVSLILSVLPSYAAAGVSMVFFLGVLLAAYAVSNKAETGSLRESHADFIIRTMWIAAFFSLITTGLAAFYLIKGVEYAQFMPCADTLANKGLDWAENAGMMEIYALIQPCVTPFIDDNMTVLLNAVALAGAPPVLYMAYRMARGLSRAIKGYRVVHPKSWF